MTDPEQTRKIIEKYNQLAKAQHTPVGQSGYFVNGREIDSDIFDKWIHFIQAYFNIMPDHKLLDVGCGSGLFLERFRGFTSGLYGADPAFELVKSAQSRLPDVRFSVSDIKSLPYDDDVFDRLFCNSVFLYLNDFEEAEKALKAFFRITNSSAKIWIGDLPWPNPELCNADYKRKETSTGWMVQHYPPQFFFRICEQFKYSCKILFQEVPGKLTAAYRYDVLIEKQ